MTLSVDSKESLEEARDFTLKQLDAALRMAKSSFNKLDRQGLKHVLYAVGQIYTAEELLKQSSENVILNEKEQQVIDRVFALQEIIFGYVQITNELKDKQKGVINE